MYFPFISRRSLTSQSHIRAPKRRRRDTVIIEEGNDDDCAHASASRARPGGYRVKNIRSGSGGGPNNGTFLVDTGTGVHPASVTNYGGGPVVTIQQGHPFAGRDVGGATRQDIYGSDEYGSGYPNIQGRGTAGRSFPFYFWPVVWWSGPEYLHPSEYGSPNNSTRPGGQLMTAAFSLGNQKMTLRLLSDNTTMNALIPQINNTCSIFIKGTEAIISTPYTASSLPKPEQAIQYYRGSTIALALDGHNNPAALSANSSTSDNSATFTRGVNSNFLYCVNTTIGSYAPLVFVESNVSSATHTRAPSSTSTPSGEWNASSGSHGLADSAPSGTGLVSFGWLVWILFSLL